MGPKSNKSVLKGERKVYLKAHREKPCVKETVREAWQMLPPHSKERS